VIAWPKTTASEMVWFPVLHRAKFAPGNMSSEGYKLHLHSITTTRDGGVVAINNHGVFRSDDAGRTWKHFPKAFRDDSFPHEIFAMGPRLIDHPEHGLMAFGNWFGEVDQFKKMSNQFVVCRSKDGGATWDVVEFDVGIPQYEPSFLWQDGAFIGVTRDQNRPMTHKHISWIPGSDSKSFSNDS
jgi:hypothetical protein